MSSPGRADIAERRRVERNTKSPLNQAGREKMFISRWSPSIRDAFSRLWYGKSVDAEPEKTLDGIKNQEMHEASEDESQNDSDSAMNSSTVSEDQVLTQLTMPSSRHVRFELPQHITTERNSPLTPSQPPPVPYVAPTPPSTARMRQTDGSDPITKITNYLETVVRPRGGECTEVEALGLSLLLQSAVNSSPSAILTPASLSPIRDFASFGTSTSMKPTFTSPNTDIGSILASSTGLRHASSHRASPSRILKQNPNGPISFDGGGSGRPHYRSPSFGGSSSRNHPGFHRDFRARKSLVDNTDEQDTGPMTTKRRRVGEDKETSVAEPSGINSGNDAVNGTQASRQTIALSSLGTRVGISRFTAATPVRPSPLRQSIRADSSSPGSSNGSPNTSVSHNMPPTSNSFIADALRSVAPPNKVIPPETGKLLSAPGEAFLNPYQQSTRHARKPTTKPLRPPPKPTRQSTLRNQPTSPPRKQTALEYIQMTAPNVGSKRAHEEVQANSAKSTKATIIDISDEESEPSRPKRQKRENVQEEKETNTIEEETVVIPSEEQLIHPSEVIEPDPDTTKQDAKSAVKARSPAYPSARSFPSVPKEPSPLRQSFRPDFPKSKHGKESQPSFGPSPTMASAFGNVSTTSTGSISFPDMSTSSSGQSIFKLPDISSNITTALTVLSASPFDPAAPSGASTNTSGTSSATSMAYEFQQKSFQESSVKETVSVHSPVVTSITTVEQTTSNPKQPQDVRAEKEATALPNSELPQFKFEIPSSSLPMRLLTASQKAATAPASELPQFRFRMPNTLETANSVIYSTDIKLQRWSCMECFTENKNEVKRCITCNRGKPNTSSITSSNSPFGPLANPNQQSIPTNEQKGFDWAAAGMKKSVTSGWRCSMCFIENSENALKCAACEIMKPNLNTNPSLSATSGCKINFGGFSAPPAFSKNDSRNENKGFDWAAAGMERSITNGWRCNVCFIENNVDALKCAACETTRPNSNVTSFPNVTPVPGVTFGGFPAPPTASLKSVSAHEKREFDWAAAGMEKAVTNGWRCDVCFIDNNPDALNCAACETLKPNSNAALVPTAASTPSVFLGGFSTPPATFLEGWKCSGCSTTNNHMLTRCAACSKSKPDALNTESSVSQDFDNVLSAQNFDTNAMQPKVDSKDGALASSASTPIFPGFGNFSTQSVSSSFPAITASSPKPFFGTGSPGTTLSAPTGFIFGFKASPDVASRGETDFPPASGETKGEGETTKE